jgi:protein-S-isoprenylcysteine O-methyltransferase Ste14
MEFIGFLVVLLVGSLIIGTVIDALSQQAVIDAISSYSPRIAEHSQTIAVICGVVLAFIVMSFPLIVKVREHKTGSNAMVKIGMATSLIVFVGSLGYLISVGIIAAQTLASL